MRARGYPELRPVSLAWVKAFPSHWTRRRLRFLLRDGYQGLKIGPFGSQIKLQDLSESGFKIYGQENVIARDFTLGQRYLDPAAFEKLSIYEIKATDLVVTMMGTSGRCAIVPDNIEPGIMDSHLVRLRTRDEISSDYLRYLIDDSPYVRTQMDLLGKGSIMHGLNSGIIKNLDLLLPLPEEQDAITKFLDRKTGQIETLITRKKELLEKLKEKRIAVITQAVTQGLNPTVPMRDSGIPWLGEMPQHWKAPALKVRYNVELGKMLNEKRISGNHLVPYLRNIDVQWDRINYEHLPSMDITEDEYPRYTIQENDVLVCEGGEVGRAAVVGRQSGVCGFQKALHRLRAETNQEIPKFIFYTLLWAVNTRVFSTEGSSTIAHLTADQLRRYRFPQPPKSEQEAIVAYLERRVGEMNKMAEKVEVAIDRLTEYRTALISAATMGKIDVRHVEISQRLA